MTIGKKLILCFAALAALLLVGSYSSLSSVASLKERFDATTTATARRIILSNEINTAQSGMLAWQRAVVLHVYGKDDAGASTARQRFREHAAAVQRKLEEIQTLVTNDEARRLTEEIRAGYQDWLTAYTEMDRLATAGDPDGAFRTAVARTLPIYDSMARRITRLVEIEQAGLDADRGDAADSSTRARWLMFALLAAALGLGTATLFVIRQISTTVGRIAAGMREGAEQVASAAAQVSTSSQALAQGASEQAASLEETSSSSEEINSMARKNAENSDAAARLMVDAAAQVATANRKLDQMVASMKEINASSDKISKIIKVIDEIAFQTNILALNAAVEAARAGEAGMGFAVVSDEVRNLAQRCAQAAKDTAGLIEDSISRSTEGSARLDEVAAAIRSMTDNTNTVKTLVDEVNLGSQEQSRGIEQVARAITQMEQVTQKTAANAEESASAGEELSAQADTLRQIVERLNALVGGEKQTGGGAAKPRLRAPVGHAVSAPGAPAAVAGRNSFPLDGDFKQF